MVHAIQCLARLIARFARRAAPITFVVGLVCHLDASVKYFPWWVILAAVILAACSIKDFITSVREFIVRATRALRALREIFGLLEGMLKKNRGKSTSTDLSSVWNITKQE
jgi:hypothetical protein